MIELFFFPSPNGIKAAIMLEECGLAYRIAPVDITRGDQFQKNYLSVNPNSKIPAITDHAGVNGPVTLFESGAILLYLANKSGRFFPTDGDAYFRSLQWLFWQVGHLGPMAGQAHYFREFCEVRDTHGIERFSNEMNRLYAVLNGRLEGRDFITGEYSIVDMACWPWIFHYQWQGQKLEDFPSVKDWFERIGNRPAVKRAKDLGVAAEVDRKSYRTVLHGQTAASVEKLGRKLDSDKGEKQ